MNALVNEQIQRFEPSKPQFSFIFSSRPAISNFSDEMMTNTAALEYALKYLKRRKTIGKQCVDILDFIADLRLPAEQAQWVIQELIKQKKIAEES